MSDQARDDLVAAMEALDRARNATGHYFQVEALPEVQASALSLLRDHGKHLLALLDAEPVAEVVEVGGSIAAVRWRGDSLPVGTPLYARPEASDE